MRGPSPICNILISHLKAASLIEAGSALEDIVTMDSAGGFGGTWYWDCEPGLMCDLESYIYLPHLKEMGYTLKERYASGEGIRQHFNNTAKKYKLLDITPFSFFFFFFFFGGF